MGGAFRKEIPDPRTGLTERERAAILQTWKHFQTAHKDYGELIFLAMFTRHPDYIELFRHFRGKSLAQLPGEAQFRAHACAVGYQLSSMVDSVNDSVLLEALIRKNAISHLERQGVHPFHFQSLGTAAIEAMKERDERGMNFIAIGAWEKFFAFLLAVTVKVFEECPASATAPRKDSAPGPSDDLPAEATGSPRGASPPGGGGQQRKSKKRSSSTTEHASPAKN
ncbi:globin-like [Dermacentor variabilis]|uniref:globin-like n=1 Tax=Dermacentor variabilis TaxID=34621 RepID=UPI003F5AF85B